jgi:hypothetical protein
MGGACSTHIRDERFMLISVGKLEGNRTGRPKRTCPKCSVLLRFCNIHSVYILGSLMRATRPTHIILMIL